MENLNGYDHAVCEQVYQDLFCNGKEREDGFTEIPAAAIQLVVSALELLRWDVAPDERSTFKAAIGICQRLRDEQKMREWKRKKQLTSDSVK